MENEITLEDELDDYLVPEMYPDSASFKNGLKRITEYEEELRKSLQGRRETIQVLAPYLKIEYKSQKKISSRASAYRRLPQNQIAVRTILPTADIFPCETEDCQIIIYLQKTADILKALLNVHEIVLYLVNNKGELFRAAREVNTSQVRQAWKIEPGSIMAGFSAFSKDCVSSSDVTSDPRFPLGLGRVTSSPLCALCVPIKSPETCVVGVFELTRTTPGDTFTKEDIQTVMAMTPWIGVTIVQMRMYNAFQQHHELTECLIKLTHHHHSEQSDFVKTLSDFVAFAKEVIDAERCSLFIVEKETERSMIVSEYELRDGARSLHKRDCQTRITRETSILGRVLFGGYSVADFNSNTDNDRSKKATLCSPITNCNKVIGAIELSNKRSIVQFTEEDEDTLETFAEFCSISIRRLQTEYCAKNLALRLHACDDMLIHHMKPCIHQEEEMCEALLIKDSIPEEYLSFSWYPISDETPKLAEIAIKLYHCILGNKFMALNDVPRFVVTVQNCYRPNPYHNFTHALIVTHAMACILKHNYRLFTKLERKALMLSSLCHDIDHRGYNNNFIQLVNHSLSSLYESSILENHHFAVTKLVMEQCGICRYVSSAIFSQLIAEICELIIATDLSLYFQSRMELMKLVDGKTFTFREVSHRRLMKGILMTACDLSGQTKPFSINKQITERLYEEFYQQGDVEKEMGVEPVPTMERDKRGNIPFYQVLFLSDVVIPCVELVSQMFISLEHVVRDTKVLLKQWEIELARVESRSTDNEDSVAV